MQNKGVVEVYFETIELRYPEEIGSSRENGFVYDLILPDYLNSIGTEKLTIYCYDREENLIYGLTHELTEATISALIKKFGYNHQNVINKGLVYCKLQHIMAFYSLPPYGFQKDYVRTFNSIFKRHTLHKT